MGAKLNSKTHLQNTFFDFLSRFVRVWNFFLNFFNAFVHQHKNFLIQVLSFCKELFYKRVLDLNFATTQ